MSIEPGRIRCLSNIVDRNKPGVKTMRDRLITVSEMILALTMFDVFLMLLLTTWILES